MLFIASKRVDLFGRTISVSPFGFIFVAVFGVAIAPFLLSYYQYVQWRIPLWHFMVHVLYFSCLAGVVSSYVHQTHVAEKWIGTLENQSQVINEKTMQGVAIDFEKDFRPAPSETQMAAIEYTSLPGILGFLLFESFLPILLMGVTSVSLFYLVRDQREITVANLSHLHQGSKAQQSPAPPKKMCR